jgi:hypothetical protein
LHERGIDVDLNPSDAHVDALVDLRVSGVGAWVDVLSLASPLPAITSGPKSVIPMGAWSMRVLVPVQASA